MCERNAFPSPCPSEAPLTRPAMSTTFKKAGTLLQSERTIIVRRLFSQGGGGGVFFAFLLFGGAEGQIRLENNCTQPSLSFNPRSRQQERERPHCVCKVKRRDPSVRRPPNKSSLHPSVQAAAVGGVLYLKLTANLISRLACLSVCFPDTCHYKWVRTAPRSAAAAPGVNKTSLSLYRFLWPVIWRRRGCCTG